MKGFFWTSADLLYRNLWRLVCLSLESVVRVPVWMYLGIGWTSFCGVASE